MASIGALSAACAVLLASPADAAPAQERGLRGVPVAFGNTVKALYPDGKHQRIWFRADGSWEAIGRRGKSSSGKWTQNGEKVCLKQSKPLPVPFKYCTHFPADGTLGAVWASKDMTGQPIKLTVVKGIER